MNKPKFTRWLRFSLRTLLLAMTVLCIWLGMKVNAARRQEEAVKAILSLHGSVFYDYEMVPMPGQPDHLSPYSVLSTLSRIPALGMGPAPKEPPVPPGPAWLRTLLGEKYFRNVYQVSFGGQLHESDLAQFKKLPALRVLYFGRCEIIGERPSIWRRFNDSDLGFLDSLRQLKELGLGSIGINGSGLAPLLKMKQLTRLNFRGSQINDSGMEHIVKLTQLQRLELDENAITDVGMKQLQNLTSLEWLSLSRTNITDAGLQYLSGLTNLKWLNLNKTWVTAEGVRDLQRSLPKISLTGP